MSFKRAMGWKLIQISYWMTERLSGFNLEVLQEVLPKLAVDKQARIGCKGKKKYWYGYKEHVSVDMQSGLINKVATTSLDQGDSPGLGGGAGAARLLD